MNCYKGMSHFWITKPGMLTHYSQTNHVFCRVNICTLKKIKPSWQNQGLSVNTRVWIYMNCKWIPIMWWHQMTKNCLFYRMVPGNRSWYFWFGSPVPLVLLNQYIDAFQTSKNCKCVFQSSHMMRLDLKYCSRSPSFLCTIEGDSEQIDFFKGKWQYWRLKLELGVSAE